MTHFYNEELLERRPTPKLKDHPLSATRDFLFNIFAATLHTEGRSSVRNLRTRHALVTGTHLLRKKGLMITNLLILKHNISRHVPALATFLHTLY
jgi:CelD/BcsL family acetyltransferase involved in cellulose biosynthesis